jgi:hypothetical protein
MALLMLCDLPLCQSFTSMNMSMRAAASVGNVVDLQFALFGFRISDFTK